MWSRKDSLNLPVLLGQLLNFFFWLSGKKRQSPARRRRRKRRKQNNGEGDEEHPYPSVSKSIKGSLPLTLDEPLTIPPALLGKISHKKWKFLLCLVLTCRSLVTSFGWCHLRKCIIDKKNECHGIHQLKSKKKRRNLWILSNQQLIFSSTHNSMIYILISPYWTIFNLNLFSLFGIEMRGLKFCDQIFNSWKGKVSDL